MGQLPAELLRRVRPGCARQDRRNLHHERLSQARADARSLAQLARRFPSVSIFDIDDLLAQVRSVLDKAVLAVQSVFVFTLFAGLTVLLAAVQSSRDERRFESAMLRTLGASRATVLQGVLAEFTTLGLLVRAAGGCRCFGRGLLHDYAGAAAALHVRLVGLAVEGLVGGAVLVAATRLACDALGRESAAAEDSARRG